MKVTTDVIVPALKIIIWATIFIVIVGGLFYLFIRVWQRHLKFFMKYTLFRGKYDETIVAWCVEAINNGMNYVDARKQCFLNGFSFSDTREIVWIFKKIEKELKGGVTNYGREHESDIRKTKIAKLPTTPTLITGNKGKDAFNSKISTKK